ncbi:uncharacterized protein LOC111889336 isoform X2 [Lactuca sativa]|uniref:uncharacterized protein LOC111889336 isoform X2 n=1 Tax=Lactuca sativa TaxID=4236 RepID=UPI001C68A6A5|nr:uncharacterized protein LOC111889336 isoform X2 [Lactuca sativa]
MNLETASSSSGPSVPQQPNLPRSDLLADESREDYLEICCGFQTASDKGDWKAAEAILEQKPELIRYAFTHNFDTPLHIAAMANSTKSMEKFVEKLVNLMDVEDLELHNKNYQTALSIAASTGNIKIAKIMLKKNKSLLEIPNSEGMMPLHVAAMYTNTNMVRYLYDKSKKMTTDSWRLENRGWVLQTCVEANHFDVALQIVNDHPELISNKRLLGDLLLCLARNTNALKGNKPNIISRIVKSMSHAECESDHDALKLLRILKEKMVRMRENDFNEILKEPPFEIEKGQQKKTTYPSRLLFVALEHGNTRFILELIRLYPLHPELILMVDDKGRSIFHIAVKYRKADIYNLLYQIGSMKESIICMKDVKGNNLLHFSAKLGKLKEFVYMPGAPIQMQQELLWFKDVCRADDASCL